ncbi:putative camp phosphodiesterase class-ii [Diaporthe ampelina]|uniref:Putative camp phosphodiesterase class-ii n=1 Tax=Diaporthe ampelina TaxID=1214573 RepID=A0A0G2FXF5_9PEZI|nr:putative camp phosphodiesterase class-ii [Diaporthe ampelina]
MAGGRGSGAINQMVGGPSPTEFACVYDSSSYFIRDVDSEVEVLIFGDVEGDSVSMNPRNLRIWQEAAPKVATGKLKAILIECSYDDSRPVDRLFGHLTPSFLVQEMTVLAEEVKAVRVRMTMDKERKETDARRDSRRGSKRKREGLHDEATIAFRRRASRALARHSSDSVNEPVSPKTMKMPRSDSGQRSVSVETPQITTPTAELSLTDLQGRTTSIVGGTSAPTTNPTAAETRLLEGPQLEGLKVVIIHVKDKMDDDERVEDTILDELQEHEAFMDVPLGCEWVISEVGQSLEV